MPAEIRTEHVYPPIPDRSWDWAAYLKDYEPGDLVGRGPTEAAAIADLKAQMDEKHGDECNRREVTEHFGDAGFTHAVTGEPIPVSAGSHTYTQSSRFCRNCGWVTCKGIIGHLLCPSCSEQW